MPQGALARLDSSPGPNTLLKLWELLESLKPVATSPVAGHKARLTTVAGHSRHHPALVQAAEPGAR